MFITRTEVILTDKLAMIGVEHLIVSKRFKECINDFEICTLLN